MHGILNGKGLDRKGELQFIKKTGNFKKGEKIFTSGLGGIYPKGLPIGKISSISDPVDSEFLKVEISFNLTPLNHDYFLRTKMRINTKNKLWIYLTLIISIALDIFSPEMIMHWKPLLTLLCLIYWNMALPDK